MGGDEIVSGKIVASDGNLANGDVGGGEMIARVFFLAGASIFGVLGTLHLLYTFFSHKFLARDPAVVDAMKGASPRISSGTTMWRAWIGFNASHSLGAMLLSAFYLLLAGRHMDVLAGSSPFAVLPVIASAAYLLLAKRYWFAVPFRGIAIATGCFATGAGLVLLR